MSKAFELYVGSMHWLDAITPPLEEHIDRLADELTALLGTGESLPAAPAASASEPPRRQPAAPTPQPPVPGSPPSRLTARRMLAVGVGVVALVALIAILLGGGDTVEESPGDTVTGSAPAGVGAGAEPAMTFENTTAVPVLVFSIDDGGSEAHEGTLEPGEEWSVDTVEGEVWVVRTAEGDGELEIVECRATAADSDCVIELVTGPTVVRVAYEVPGSATTGAFERTRGGAWKETGADGSTRFLFAEEGRDDWSVYLSDEGRGVEIQLDLWTERVLYSDASAPEPRLLYRITDASD
jgi:hypothetical protein